LVILSEVGTDMHRWPSVKHFCSGLGWCPQHRISGRKELSRYCRLAPCRQQFAPLPECLGAFFRRMKTRLGTPKAITTTAHKLARLVYSLLKHGSASVSTHQGIS
jgi:hypothetical protein